MKFAPKVAVSLAVVSILWSPIGWQFASSAQSPSDIRIDIDSRLGQLEDRVKTAHLEGRLTTDEADNFKSAIGQIAEAEAGYLAVSGKLGPAMLARLQTATNRLEKRFDTTLHDRKVAIVDLSAAESLTADLIAQARKDGRLQDQEMLQLQNELKAVRDLESSLRNDGSISYGDSLLISMQLDRVVEHLGRLLDDVQYTPPTADALANEVSTTLVSGKITADQTNAFRKEYDTIVAQIAKLKDIKNNSIKAQQQLFLASEMELLKNKVDLAAQGKALAVAPREREQQIDFAIADALVSGKLTPAEAHELRAELQGTIEEIGTDANAALADDKALRVVLELERLAGQTNRWLHAPGKVWTGLDAFQAGFDHRVEEALRANRITAEQAAALRAAADKVAKAETDLRASNGRLDTAEALDLAMQIETLNVQLHHDKKDRDITVPDIDALQKELDRFIAEGIESGKIPGVSRWTERLSQVKEMTTNFEKSPAGMDARAKLAIADSYADAIADVQAQVHRDIPFELSLDLRLDQLGDRISNAAATGILGVERATQYRAGVDAVYSKLLADRKSDNGLAATEALALANDVNVLTSQLEEELRDAAMFAPEIADRLQDLELRIGRAVANGRLNVREANELMQDVDRKSAAINHADSAEGGISHGEGLKLAYDVQRLNTRFETMLHDDPVPVTDVAHRAMLLDNKLANALAAGELTVPEAQQFKSSLERVLSSSAIYRNTDAGLSYPEAVALSIELDHLGTAVEQGMHKDTANRDVDTRESELHRRLKDLVAAGKMTQKDADAFAYDLDRIEESEAAFRVSEEGLNYAEALTLSLDLDRLAARLDGYAKSGLTAQPKTR